MGVEKQTITKLEGRAPIEVAARQQLGYVADEAWGKSTAALGDRGVCWEGIQRELQSNKSEAAAALHRVVKELKARQQSVQPSASWSSNSS